ncbi:MAG: VanW family protein [Clostridia bacterium]|nr:VanW family protein [Clostridia bacterium]
MKKFITVKIVFLSIFVLLALIFSSFGWAVSVFAMPFYDLQPQETVLRAEFSTDYSKSSAERKHNIALAAKSLDKTLIDVGGEFSFNRTVGARTEKRGYKSAKIIVKGEFVEGVGGGVCQVSTTVYNAAIRAGLDITEAHGHSLAVSYVKPSCDAMVNSGSADLRFINRTHNPVIIRAFANGKTLTVKIFGEPMTEKHELKSVILEEIPPEYTVIKDNDGEYPDLYLGERRIIKNGVKGIISEGYLITTVNGKTVSKARVRRDRYLSVGGVIVEGTVIPPEQPINDAAGENLEMTA